MIEGRRFIAKASGLAVAAAAPVVDAPSVIAQPKVQWRLSTTWTKSFDVLQGVTQRLVTPGRCTRRSRSSRRW